MTVPQTLPPTGNGPVDLALMQLKMEVQNVATDITDIKKAIAEIVQLDKNLASLTIKNNQVNIELQALKDSNASLKQKVNHMDTESRAFMNKVRGAGLVFGVVGAVLQAGIVAACSWLIATTEDNHVYNQIQESRIEHLEHSLEKLNDKQSSNRALAP